MSRYAPNPSDPQTVYFRRSNAADLQAEASAYITTLAGRLITAIGLSGGGNGSLVTLAVEHTDAADGFGVAASQVANSLRIFEAASAPALNAAYAAAFANAVAANPGVPFRDSGLAGTSHAAVFFGFLVLATQIGGGGGGGNARLLDLSVNAARLDQGYPAGAIVLRTGARTNAAGAYTGGGTGNKAITGVFGFDGLPLGSLLALSYTWTSVVGPVGPTWIPPGAASVVVPYVNFVVDFNPAGPSDLRILVVTDSGLGAPISPSIGTYTNDGFNNITHAWALRTCSSSTRLRMLCQAECRQQSAWARAGHRTATASRPWSQRTPPPFCATPSVGTVGCQRALSRQRSCSFRGTAGTPRGAARDSPRLASMAAPCSELLR